MPLILKTRPSGKDEWCPKYVDTNFSLMPYGKQNIALVAADVEDAVDTAISANADVRRLPDDLDQQLGAATAAVQAALESRNLPAGWVLSTMTYRQVLKVLIGCMQFLRRFAGVTQIATPFIGGAVTLNTQFNQLSALNRQRLLTVAATFNLNTSGLGGTNTLRQILKNVADQLNWPEVKLGGITI